MYTTSWGLHTTWSKLVETALVWKDVRPFRLARLRHATELEAGESHVNLASLPTEILNMIEDEIIKSARQRVSLQAPLFFDEDCCMESFVQWEPYWEALDLWAVLNDYDPGDQDSYNAAVSAFGGTQEAESLTDEYWQFHLESGQCLALARSSEFWPFLASGKYYWEADFDLEDQLFNADEVVQAFVADFNFQLRRRAYDDEDEKYEANTVTLLFNSFLSDVKYLTRKIKSRTPDHISLDECQRFLHQGPLRPLFSKRQTPIDVAELLRWIILERDDENTPSSLVVEYMSKTILGLTE